MTKSAWDAIIMINDSDAMAVDDQILSIHLRLGEVQH